MPKQNNCDDLKVESCVDDNGQTISGGDSYDVPTGRYVKHVVNVCETAGSGGGGGGSSIDPNLYYTKTEVDALLAALDIPDLDDYYDKTEIDALIADYYSKDEIDKLIEDIEGMDPANYYDKDEIDEKFDELDTGGVNVVGTTFSALDDIKTQQDVNTLLYGMALKPPGSPTTVKTEVSGEQFAEDNDLKNQKDVNEFLDERLTVIEETDAIDPSYFVTKPELLVSQKEQDAVIGASFKILENQVLAIENGLNHNNDEDERVHSDLYAKIDEVENKTAPLRYRYKAVNYNDFADEAGTIGLAVGEADGSSGLDPSIPMIALSAIVWPLYDLNGNSAKGFEPNSFEIFIHSADKDSGRAITYRVDLKEGGQRGYRRGFVVGNGWYSDSDNIYIEAGADVELIFLPTHPKILDIDKLWADQKRQDDALSAERSTRAVNEVKIDQSIKELVSKNQREHSDLYAKIDVLEAKTGFDPFPLEEKIEQEKIYRIDGDAKISAGLVEEARIRADEDYKLLARINGLDIPEMPGDYDDSGLRELIERESALRTTGDAGLQRLIEDNTESIRNTNDAIGAERVTRADQVAKINADLNTEVSARKAADSDLQAQLDALEIPDDFAETILRLDNDIQVTNQKIDFNAEETLKDQKRQDEQNLKLDAVIEAEILALAQKEKTDHEDHEQRIADLEAVPPGSGAEYLGDLLDVDLSGTFSVRKEEEYTWRKYTSGGTPVKEGYSKNGDYTLIISEDSWIGDPSALFSKFKPGLTLEMEWTYATSPGKEERIITSAVKTGSKWAVTFSEKPDLFGYCDAQPLLGDTSTLSLRDASVVVIPDPPVVDPIDPIIPPVDPNPPTVTAGTFLSYDDAKKLWVPKTLDVSGGGVTDLSSYYTKTEVDATQSAQDDRLDALEAGGGSGGSVNLDNYYTKTETYSRTEVDDLISGIDTNVSLDDYYTKSEVDTEIKGLDAKVKVRQ